MPTLARVTKRPLHHSLKAPLSLSQGAAGHQDQPAIPNRNELFPRQQIRPWRQRRLDEDLVLPDPGDHQEPAVAQDLLNRSPP